MTPEFQIHHAEQTKNKTCCAQEDGEQRLRAENMYDTEKRMLLGLQLRVYVKARD